MTAVTAEPPATLLLAYSDGQLRGFDCSSYLDRGLFMRLNDATLFVLAFVAYGTVCWPGDLDIAPETLFLGSTPAKATRPTAASH